VNSLVPVPTLRDIEPRLGGRPRRSGNRLETNTCPCCGDRRHSGKRRRAPDRIFYVEETNAGLLVWCHACHASWEDIFAALGVRHFFTRIIDNNDPGLFDPEALVLREVRRGEIEVVCDFGPDKIGRLANTVVDHLVPARRKAAKRDPRFKWLPEDTPVSVRFARRLLRKLGIRVGTEKAHAIRRRINASVADHPYHVRQRKNDTRGYRSLLIFNVATRANRVRLNFDTKFDGSRVITALSCYRRQVSRAGSSLERFLTTSISAHAPPALLNEQPKMTPALAAFLGQGAA
jgi:hypothetical protein